MTLICECIILWNFEHNASNNYVNALIATKNKLSYLLLYCALTTGGNKSGSMAISKAFRAKVLAVAGLAVDLLVRAITSYHRIQRTVTLAAVKALFVPHL